MPLRRYVGLRLSGDPEAVPTTDDIAEGDLAFNTASERLYARFGEVVRDITDRYTRAEIDEMLGTAAGLDAPEEGDAGAEQVVLGSDSRLSDARAPTAHTHTWQQVTEKPDTAIRWPTFAEVTDRPAAYPPESHTHTLSSITDAGSAAAKDAKAFDAAGRAAQVEHDIRETLRQQPDPLLMHFL